VVDLIYAFGQTSDIYRALMADDIEKLKEVTSREKWSKSERKDRWNEIYE